MGEGRAAKSTSSARALGIEKMAERCVQGRAVMIDLRAHFGDERIVVGHEQLMRVLEADRVEIETGDMVCLHTGFADRLLAMRGQHVLSQRQAPPDGPGRVGQEQPQAERDEERGRGAQGRRSQQLQGGEREAQKSAAGVAQKTRAGDQLKTRKPRLAPARAAPAAEAAASQPARAMPAPVITPCTAARPSIPSRKL